MRQKRKHRGVFLMTLGLLLVLGAGGLTIYNMRESTRAGKEAEEVVEEIDEILTTDTEPEYELVIDDSGDMSYQRVEVQEEDPSEGDSKEAKEMLGGTGARDEEFEIPGEPVDKPMPVLNINGVYYIGTLYVPTYNLRLPIAAEYTYEQLNTSPTRYTGNYYLNNMVLCGHNYVTHFSQLKWIPPGSEIIFTNVDGEVFTYTVSRVETIRPTAIEQMTDNTNEDWDLTLFTCTVDGTARSAVRCIRVIQ